MKEILLVGGSGFIGRAVGESLARKGYVLRLLTRSQEKPFLPYPCKAYHWDGKTLPKVAVQGVYAVLNFAGESIVGRRWSKAYKERLRNSRIDTSKALVQAILSLKEKPELVIQASAIGYYGLKNRKEICSEKSTPGKDFLGNLCVDWEKQLEPLQGQLRICTPRLGVVLGWGGGAFAQLWNLYASGLGAQLSDGQQWMNWVHLEDVVSFFEAALEESNYQGSYNLVSPGNISQKVFHKELCRRSASMIFMRSPSIVLKAILGESAKLLVEGCFVQPKHLLQTGFEFRHKDLDSALADLLEQRHDPRAFFHGAKIWLPTTLDKIWDFSSSAHNLERITPPWLKFKVKSLSTKTIQKDTIIKYTLRLKGIPFFWRTCITQWQPKRVFADNQDSGPYKLWYHKHIFTELAGGVLAEDRVDYRLPVYPLSLPAFPLIKNDVEKIFSYRSKILNEIFNEDKTTEKKFE